MHDNKTVAPAPGFSPLPGESVRAVEAFGADCEPGPRRRWAADFGGRGRIQSRAARLETAVRRTALAEASQPAAALQRLPMSPFVHFRHFQNRVTKGAKKGQKVPESDIGSFPPSGVLWFPVDSLGQHGQVEPGELERVRHAFLVAEVRPAGEHAIHCGTVFLNRSAHLRASSRVSTPPGMAIILNCLALNA